ncbi:MAG: AAA family ATPase [Gemmatimonadaceae bacterium]
MAADDPRILALREAVRVAPADTGLRRLLAESLAERGYLVEAEAELREALRLDPRAAELKLALAHVFHRNGKVSAAQVVVEDLIASSPPPPAAGDAARTLAQARLLNARILAGLRETGRAVEEYRAAQRLDPQAADPDLADRLGLGAPVRGTAEVVEGRVRAASAAEAPAERGRTTERPRVTFADVGGMGDLKEEIQLKIVHPLAHPDLYRAYGKPVGGGILMYGPPGCGKTHIARATAGEISASFMAVGISDVLDMWIGQSERKLHELFEQARRDAPCVLFFDEVDALAASRSDLRASAGRQLINQFLAELDGVQASNDGVLIMAATNAPWHLDNAFRRPGRFDRILFVPPPDAPARAAILRILLRGKPTEPIAFDDVAKKTDAFSGADLKGAVDLAVERKLAEAIRRGTPTPITTRDLAAAVKDVRATTKEWFSTARNYALYANQGGFYDAVAAYLKLE